MNRRRFLKYAGATATVVGASVAAFYLCNAGPRSSPQVTTPTTTQVGTSVTEAITTTTASGEHTLTRSKEGYPLLGCYDHRHYQIQSFEIEQFARWDMLTVNFETAHAASDALREIRNLNPKIKILAWISLGFYRISEDSTVKGWGGYLETKFLADSNEDWWIHKKGVEPPSLRRLHMVPWYPDQAHPNPKSAFSDHIVKFLQEEVLSTGLYDGIFYDCTWDDGYISQQLTDTDISASEYREGVTGILKETREILGPSGMMMGNPGVEWRDTCAYWEYANGHYQENALGDVFGSGWGKVWEIYQRNMRKKSPPARMHWIGVDTQYKRDRSTYGNVTRKDLTDEDLRRMRLGLGTALLLDNGYFGFDLGDGYHGYGEQWWFPEYDANLGFPSSNYEKAGDGTYRRRYDNGLVIVNPGFDKTIDLSVKYRDVTTNEISDRIKVPAKDARLLITA